MNTRIRRSVGEPLRQGLSWPERWSGPDAGLITCWEVGRELAQKDPELAERAGRGELPVLGWKGGVERMLQAKKFGTLNYLAQWQGLRAEDLDVEPSEDYELTCARTGMTVIYTGDKEKWSQP